VPSTEEKAKACERACQMLKRADIAITDEERQNMEVADFGLGMLEQIGLEIIVYINSNRYCAKELILFPGQTCPEHRHPARGSDPGKMETFRCRSGEVYLYMEGPKTPNPKVGAPAREEYFTVWNEVILKPGEQYTLPSDTLHWFRAGEQGAIVSEFSSPSDDESDIFTDPLIQRVEKPE